MPIKFISLNYEFNEMIREYGYEAKMIPIQDYEPIPSRKTYYVSPANSLCFMDGGIDYALSRIVFPNIEPKIKGIVKNIGIKSYIGKYYLPIGSSIIVSDDNNSNKMLVVAPTMLLPQNVSMTDNAYYATMAVLYNVLVNCGENLDNIDILFTSLCCGYGKMEAKQSVKQIIKGIDDYKNYKPNIYNENIIINEPNLLQQPKYYQNTEWFNIHPSEILLC